MGLSVADPLLAELEVALRETVALVDSGLRKLIGPTRGTLTDAEADVLTALVVACRHRDPSIADPTDHYEENPA